MFEVALYGPVGLHSLQTLDHWDYIAQVLLISNTQTKAQSPLPGIGTCFPIAMMNAWDSGGTVYNLVTKVKKSFPFQIIGK